MGVKYANLLSNHNNRTWKRNVVPKVTILGVILMILYLTIVGGRFELGQNSRRRHPLSADQCVCLDSKGRPHNFCYSHKNLTGKRYDCEYMKIVEEFGLLGDGLDAHPPIDLNQTSIAHPIMVTAWSDNHHWEGMRLVYEVRSRWPNQKIIVYDLGMSPGNVTILQNICNVEYREFPFSRFPSYVRNLEEYRWKPLIYAEVLNEYGAAWWIDSSVKFSTSNLHPFYQLFNCASGSKYSPTNGTKDVWNEKMISEISVKCEKYPVILPTTTVHGNVRVTQKFMYDYIPTVTQHLLKPNTRQWAATVFFGIRTEDTIQHIFKWWVLCALQESCMSGSGAKRNCEFQGEYFKPPAICHRFDQVAINLLLVNRHPYENKNYISEGVGNFLSIERSAPMKNYNMTNLPCVV